VALTCTCAPLGSHPRFGALERLCHALGVGSRPNLEDERDASNLDGDRLADSQPLELSPALRTALIASVAGIIFVGVYPQPVINLAQKLIAPLAALGSVALK